MAIEHHGQFLVCTQYLILCSGVLNAQFSAVNGIHRGNCLVFATARSYPPKVILGIFARFRKGSACACGPLVRIAQKRLDKTTADNSGVAVWMHEPFMIERSGRLASIGIFTYAIAIP